MIEILMFAIVGAIVRIVFGIYHAYSNYESIMLSWKRLLVEFIASICFGLFCAMILNELGFWKIGVNITAMVSGLLGANLINTVARKFGVSKLTVNVVEKVEYPDLNIAQQRAIDYLKLNKKITTKIYRKINDVSKGAANWDLAQLVQKGYLKKFGKGKATYYVLAKNSN
jgi:hypothetical protein